MTLAAGKLRRVPARLLTALLRAGAPEDEIRRHYGLGPDEPIPTSPAEPVRVEDMDLVPDDGHRYELREGELVRRSATKRRHGAAAGAIVGHLHLYLTQHPIGTVYIAETGFRMGSRSTLYCPDAAYVSAEREADVGPDEFFPFAPDIAIEVWRTVRCQSPENTERKMATKARDYLTHGAKAVWVLRPQDRTVRVHRPSTPVQILQEADLLTDEELPGFSVRVGDLFPVSRRPRTDR
jgi:Uma2 family endonuclease